MQGHCGAIDPRTGLDEGDVWDLATHPKLPIFATVGEDRSIRMWSLKEKRMLRHARLPAKGRSVAWHPSEGCDHVAVGTFGGAVIVVDYVRGTTVAMSQHAPDGAPITALRYSPCGKFLGLACQDGRFRVLDVHCAYKLVDQTDAVENPDADFLGKKAKRNDGGKEAMTHVDWSADSKFVQINTAGADLKFFTAPQCDQVPSASPEILACDWATWSLPYGWASQGAWKPDFTPGDINAVARCNKGDWLEGERVLAVADDFGTVRLARYPANVGVSAEREYHGHSARVTGCEFSASDKWLITTGGGDRCVFVWRHKDPDGPADGPDGSSPHAGLDKLKLEDARTAPPDMSAGDAPTDDDTDSDEEDNVEYDGGKSLVPKVMVQSGMEHGVAVLHARQCGGRGARTRTRTTRWRSWDAAGVPIADDRQAGAGADARSVVVAEGEHVVRRAQVAAEAVLGVRVPRASTRDKTPFTTPRGSSCITPPRWAWCTTPSTRRRSTSRMTPRAMTSPRGTPTTS